MSDLTPKSSGPMDRGATAVQVSCSGLNQASEPQVELHPVADWQDSTSLDRPGDRLDGTGADIPDEPSLMERLRLVLWAEHQDCIAPFLGLLLLVIALFFGSRWYTQKGLVEIDQASSLVAEFKIDLNSAELGEIIVLPGVGEKLAQAIMLYRNENGPFRSPNELENVPGIGEKKVNALAPYLLPLPLEASK